MLAACASGGAGHGGRLSKVRYLSAIEAVPAPMRNGATGAPVIGLVVSGTVTNAGRAPLHCSANMFLLVNARGDDMAPTTGFCAVARLPVQQSTYFNATFVAAPGDRLKLRFEHGDGSYEVHDLAVPPG